MSKKSTARTGSDGDADWNLSDLYPNVCSGSSSYRSTKDIDCCHTEGYPHIWSGSSSCQQKREVEGGPFGDTVHARKPPQTSDYVILMLQDDESNSSEDSDPELYSLRNDYIEKLNILRQRLNLIELNSKSNDCRSGCKITEIHDEGPEASTSTQKGTESVMLCQSQQTEVEEQYLESKSTHTSDTVEVETIHPFSLRFTADTKSITNLFEVEYNPPKKKSCFRLKTPKLSTCSESNLPYHTKVSLHDGTFKPEAQRHKAQEAERILKEGVSKFCSNKEVQCSEADLEIPDDIVVINLTEESDEESVSSFSRAKVDIGISENSEESNSRAASPILAEELYYPIFGNREEYLKNRKVNRVCKVSSDSYDTGTTSGDTSSKPSPLRKHYSHRNKVSPGKSTPSTGVKKRPFSVEFLAKTLPDASGDKPFFQKNTLGGIQEEGRYAKKKHTPPPQKSYVTYRVTTERVKSSPIRGTRKTPVPFGPMIANNCEKSQPLEDRFNFYNASEPSEDDKRFDEYYGVMESEASVSDSRNSGFWNRIFSCFRPIFGFLTRRG